MIDKDGFIIGNGTLYVYESGAEPEKFKEVLKQSQLAYEKEDKRTPNIDAEFVYCLCPYDRIDEYKLTQLFDIGGIRFSDGFGHSWNYADEDVTWSKNPALLYEKLYDDKRVNANRYKMIDDIMQSHLDDATKKLAITALLFGFQGTMYGEIKKANSELVDLNIDRVELAYKNNEPEGFIYVWGWPGPDCSFYYFKDFNKTWFLKRGK